MDRFHPLNFICWTDERNLKKTILVSQHRTNQILFHTPSTTTKIFKSIYPIKINYLLQKQSTAWHLMVCSDKILLIGIHTQNQNSVVMTKPQQFGAKFGLFLQKQRVFLKSKKPHSHKNFIASTSSPNTKHAERIWISGFKHIYAFKSRELVHKLIWFWFIWNLNNFYLYSSFEHQRYLTSQE